MKYLLFLVLGISLSACNAETQNALISSASAYNADNPAQAAGSSSQVGAVTTQASDNSSQVSITLPPKHEEKPELDYKKPGFAYKINIYKEWNDDLPFIWTGSPFMIYGTDFEGRIIPAVKTMQNATYSIGFKPDCSDVTTVINAYNVTSKGFANQYHPAAQGLVDVSMQFNTNTPFSESPVIYIKAKFQDSPIFFCSSGMRLTPEID
jgi:hypothetical protein